MQQNNLFIFGWNKCPQGYEIIEQPKKPLIAINEKRKVEPHNFLCEEERDAKKPRQVQDQRQIRPKTREVKDYSLFKKKQHGISRTFSGILKYDGSRLNDDRLLKFTKTYGLLGISALSSPEPLDTWLVLAQHFKKIYDFIDGEDALDHARAITFFNGLPQPILVSPFIIPEPDENSSFPVSKNKSFFHMKPHNLLAAMYLDLGEQLTHGADLQKCANPKCIQWFKRRSNKLHCSDACKTEKCRQGSKKN